jgi:hypothetical protein
MALSLPLPVRVAAGLVVTGWNTLIHLPTELPALSVMVAGQAVKLSMRIQQEITELAGRGDELLAGLTNHPSEHPAWAHFDEEDGDAQAVATDGPESVAVTRPGRTRFDDEELDVDVAWVAVGESAFNDDVEILAEFDEWQETALGETHLSVLLEFVEPVGDQDADASAADGSEAGAPESDDSADVIPLHPGSADSAETEVEAPDGDDSDPLEESQPAVPSADSADVYDDIPTVVGPTVTPGSIAGDGASQPPGDTSPFLGGASGLSFPAAGTSGASSLTAGRPGPASMPGYDRMTLAQVRGRLRGLSQDTVAGLLAYEQSGSARAPFLTLLSNRMATLEHEAQ